MYKTSVTELLKLLDKPALLNWANKQGLQGIDISKDRSKWLKDGTSIHSQIENFLLKGTPFINKETQFKFVKFMANKEVLGIENKIETEWFTGRYDIKLLIENKEYIVDWKLNHKTLYLENKLQLIGYAMSEKCDGLAIVSVPDLTLMKFSVSNREPYEEILKALAMIYNYKKEIENGKL